jgi:hypothetical protein
VVSAWKLNLLKKCSKTETVHTHFVKNVLEDTIVGVDCKEFQSLKDGERGSEDLMAMELAKNKRWKRCPKCSFYVEKSEGCTRISCRYTQFYTISFVNGL